MTQIDETNQDTYREHSVGSHSDDRGGDSDLPCYCDRHINQDTTSIDELYEKVEACFDLRISSSGASITIKLGGEQMTVDYEAFLELRKKIEALISDQVAKARLEEWRNIHTKHVVGSVVGNYKITERFRKIGKNTKYKVVCTLCGAPMFRYSNKFKMNHRNCPATLNGVKNEQPR